MLSKAWEANYKGHVIRVENRAFGERLLIDGQVQDRHAGLAMHSRLKGEVAADGRTEAVVADLGGFWRVECRLEVAGATVPVQRRTE